MNSSPVEKQSSGGSEFLPLSRTGATQIELLTLNEAMRRREISSCFLYARVKKGLVTPVEVATRSGKSRKMYRSDEIDALEVVRKNRTVSVTEQKEVDSRMGGKRFSKCLRDLSLNCFNKEQRGLFNRRGKCKECEYERYQTYYDANRDRLIAYKKHYRKANRNRIRVYKREYQRRIRAIGDERYEGRRAYLNRYNANRDERRNNPFHRNSPKFIRDRDRQARNERAFRAVQDGKASPITRHAGFLVVRKRGTNDIRAARRDYPLNPGEYTIADFTLSPIYSEKRKLGWVAHRPLLTITNDDECLLRLLQAKEFRERSSNRNTKTVAKEEYTFA